LKRVEERKGYTTAQKVIPGVDVSLLVMENNRSKGSTST
jgi:hypothetical protein